MTLLSHVELLLAETEVIIDAVIFLFIAALKQPVLKSAIEIHNAYSRDGITYSMKTARVKLYYILNHFSAMTTKHQLTWEHFHDACMDIRK